MDSRRTDTSPFGEREPLDGYVHNIRYKASIYHVQTEDSGPRRPQVLTHLFLEGMIVASLRTGYRELLSRPDAEATVREMMQEQHKQIMRMLRRGELDLRIEELKRALGHEVEPATPVGGLQASTSQVVPISEVTTAEGRLGVTLVDFPPLLDPWLGEPGPGEEQAVGGSRPPSALDLPAGGELESLELEPLAEAAQMLDPAAHQALAVELTPPPERIVDRRESRSIRRGRAISQELKLPSQPGKAIELDHPAFSAFPMLDWEADSDGSVELDLETIDSLDLNSEPRRLSSQQLEAIEAELDMPPEPLPPPRPLAERPYVAEDHREREVPQARRGSSGCWGQELELEQQDDDEADDGADEADEIISRDDVGPVLTAPGPIPIPPQPRKSALSEELSPLPALKGAPAGRPGTSLPPVQPAQAPLPEVEPRAPTPLKRTPSPVPQSAVGVEAVDEAGAEADRETELAGEEAAPRRSKTPSLPVIPLNKLYEFTPEESDFATGEQRIKARPRTAPRELTDDAADSDPD